MFEYGMQESIRWVRSIFFSDLLKNRDFSIRQSNTLKILTLSKIWINQLKISVNWGFFTKPLYMNARKFFKLTHNSSYHCSFAFLKVISWFLAISIHSCMHTQVNKFLVCVWVLVKKLSVDFICQNHPCVSNYPYLYSVSLLILGSSKIFFVSLCCGNTTAIS